MNHFIIKCATSYGSIAMLRLFAENPKVTFKKVDLNVLPMPTDSQDIEDWPVRFTCKTEDPENSEFEIYIHMLTCGYPGSGPHDLLTALEMTGFGNILSEEAIFTRPKIVGEYYSSKT